MTHEDIAIKEILKPVKFMENNNIKILDTVIMKCDENDPLLANLPWLKPGDSQPLEIKRLQIRLPVIDVPEIERFLGKLPAADILEIQKFWVKLIDILEKEIPSSLDSEMDP